MEDENRISGSYPEWRRDRPFDARQPDEALRRFEKGANSGERGSVREMRAAATTLPVGFSHVGEAFFVMWAGFSRGGSGTMTSTYTEFTPLDWRGDSLRSSRPAQAALFRGVDRDVRLPRGGGEHPQYVGAGRAPPSESRARTGWRSRRWSWGGTANGGFSDGLHEAAREIRQARPTGANLGWAVERLLASSASAQTTEGGDSRPRRRGGSHTPRGRGEQSSHRGERREADTVGKLRADSLQHGRAGDGRIRHGAGDSAVGVGRRAAGAGLCHRDEAAVAGRASDGVGTAPGRDTGKPAGGLGCWASDASRAGSRGHGRRRPHSLERRRRQQDRHLQPGGSGRKRTESRSTSRRRQAPWT